jgi:hypothetical protein
VVVIATSIIPAITTPQLRAIVAKTSACPGDAGAR